MAAGTGFSTHLDPRPEDTNLPILLVDDEPFVTEALGEYLEDKGLIVHRAAEMEEAQAMLSVFSYGAVITDIRMTESYPADEGFHVIETARECQPDTSVIVLTGLPIHEIRTGALERGALCILPKPFPLPELEQIVRQAIRRRATCRQP